MRKNNIRPSSPDAKKRMENVGSKDTEPELAVRSLIHEMGLRYRVDERPIEDLNRRADIMFPKQKIAIFIDGCFWHGCPEHGTWPKQNAEFWEAKIRRNKERDKDTDQKLRDAGWEVFRFWEHEDPDMVAKKINDVVRRAKE